ncbi:alpha/beta hydrolase [Mycobacterium nebraskense]|uniref:Esterase n=1 Tax=Mycobacterium nebraskense TaxID=244292 RepID=A0A1X1ZWV6_9MYCO|nr:alpha/beta hydrolase [Mycobacterium nebraskense]KKC03911.1 esterase [Mycobacterium nebraskense]MBI2696369.1 alpha/beta hydrolase [Mycobacterium nebraskense]MCV7115832.1 alpha/beta hydrolase [Mycobacterium nebraskense]ORW28337.1 esterase [Mycobacterium nebraskense]
MTSCAKWLLRAHPGDYALALSVAGASLPVVGKHLEPLGGLTAMGIWGARHAPDFFSGMTKPRQPSPADETPRRDRESIQDVSVAALRGIVAAADLELGWPAALRTPPIWDAMRQRRYLHRRAVHYGDHRAQVLDVWRRKDLPAQPAPVLIFVPGGAWVHGKAMGQGSALMSRLAEQGWVCLAIDYRVAPHHRWPRHIIDVKTAIAWARANVDKFGGDRDFVAVAGCSAGGHLSALAGLTPDDAQYHANLPEGANTSVDAVVGIYGRYDWEDRSTPERDRFVDFLERVVVKRRIARHPEVFRDASPMARVHRNAPPFLVIHGSKDSVIPVEQARSFVDRMRAVSHSMVGYLELPGAGHGYDLIDGERAGAAAHATSLFLNQVYRTKTNATKEVI